MLNSVSTGSTGSRWLDRLRTAKGFPDSEVADLENFLRSSNSPIPERSYPSSDPISGPILNEDNQLCNIMSNVLNELFCFGDNCSNSTNSKKSARKQANPRICAFPDNGSNGNKNVVPENAKALRSGDNNCGVEVVKVLDQRDNEEECDGNLSGFSRTEVTVIDTSYESWKFEKLLYRKKNVWKVRNKKGKSETVGSKKKRKGSKATEKDQCRGKKRNVAEKEGCAMECELPLNEAYNHRSYKSEAHEKARDKVRKLLKNK